MKKKKRIAVLGSGIMGSSTALLLARRGHEVSLYDEADKPFSGASCWNEGKIHLGFLYSADPTLRTAREVIQGGLAFRPLVENLTGCSLEAATTASADIYLCHRSSVVTPTATWDYMQQVMRLINEHPNAKDYLVDVSEARVERLAKSEIEHLTASPEILGGIRVPEHSVATIRVADQFVNALAAEPRVQLKMKTRIIAASPVKACEREGLWNLETTDGPSAPYDSIVNALWHGRLAVDCTAGIAATGTWSNRYRLSLFVRTTRDIDAPSAVIATGPFGDIKNYDNRNFYLSWYPAGLLTDSSEVMPPSPPNLDIAAENKTTRSILDNLEKYFPVVREISENAQQMQLRGGWVFAAGRGKLSDPKSTLHRRDSFGIRREGSYVSVDTGKYSSAPWLAHKVVDAII